MSNKLSLIDFFKKYSRIEIPKIQRDYAQGRENESEVADRFLNKIFECLKYSTDLELDFIYGSVDKVDNVDKNVVYLLDGQQRVTTLFLLYWYIALKEDKYKEIECLTKFTYSTRVSSREFCQNIINHIKNIKQYYDETSKDDDKVKLCNIIKDFYWFTNENDPTIKAMLNMIDKIDEKYNEITKDNNSIKLFDNLEKIQFYFLPLEDFKLTDEIYLKMNARGKPLTSFENFKALLEDFFKDKIDEDILQQYKIKIDTSWVNFIWILTKDYKKVDDLFMKLFSFIFEMLYYSQIEIVEDTRKLQIEKSNLKLFELFFSHIGDKEKKEYINKLIENENYKITTSNENINFIINIFDILSSLGKCKLETLFNDIFYYNNESENDEDKYNKICTFDNNLNVFNNDDNLFEFTTIRKRILIFSVFKILNYEYLKNKENIIDNIKNTYFNKLRLIRNLLYNTDNLYGNIYYQMKLIDKIITEDEITVMENQLSDKEKRIKNILFTDKLVESEKNKLTILENTDENTIKRIYACENNVFLQGNINFILDYLISPECNDNVVYIINNIFIKVGFNNKDGSYLIHRAMLSFICNHLGTIDTSYMYKDYNIWNNKENNNDKEGFINFIKNISSKINNDNIEESTKESIKESCKNIIEHFEEKKDENDFRYLLIKDATDSDGKKKNLFHYSNDKKLINNILYHKKNVNIHDILLNTNVYKILKEIQNDNKEFNFYIFNNYNSIQESNNSHYLIYNDEEILYLYSYLMLAYKLEKHDCYIGFLILKNIIYIGVIYDDNKKNKEIIEKVKNKFKKEWILDKYISYKCLVLHFYNIFNNLTEDGNKLNLNQLDKVLKGMIEELNKVKKFIEEL